MPFEAASSRYERFALIYDPEHSRLGSEALGLVERGIDPLYAGDPDEAHLLALQETGRVGALVLPGSLPLDQLDSLLDRITPQLWAGPAAVVIVGPPSERGLLRELRDRGVSWTLREPYDASEFRFVVSAALATDDKLEPRSGLRVPIALPATLRADGEACHAATRNLSIGGAYVAVERALAPAQEVEIEIGLGERALSLAATVVYCQTRTAWGRAEREPGVGIAFRGVVEDDRNALASFVRERVDSFRL